MTDNPSICEGCPYLETGCLENVRHFKHDILLDALALLKAQETSLERIAEDYGLTVDGISFALDQYKTIICEITHGMMSKLSYYASDVLRVAQERWCNTCELKEAQEPVEPILKREGWNKYHNDYVCPVCDQELVYEQNYCSKCGRAVKWDV